MNDVSRARLLLMRLLDLRFSHLACEAEIQAALDAAYASGQGVIIAADALADAHEARVETEEERERVRNVSVDPEKWRCADDAWIAAWTTEREALRAYRAARGR